MTRPAGDGYRVITGCADGCGADVVCLPEYVGRARCVGCGRRHHGITAAGKVPLDRPGASMPGWLDPGRLTRAAEVDRPAPAARGLVEEWQLNDPRLPRAVALFIAGLRAIGVTSTRVCHTVTDKEIIGVHWGGGFAFWTRRVARRKVDLKRTPAGRRKVQRFDPIVSWAGEVYSPAALTVTEAMKIIRQRTGS